VPVRLPEGDAPGTAVWLAARVTVNAGGTSSSIDFIGFPSYCHGIPDMAICCLTGGVAWAVVFVVWFDGAVWLYVKCAGSILMAVRHCWPCSLWWWCLALEGWMRRRQMIVESTRPCHKFDPSVIFLLGGGWLGRHRLRSPFIIQCSCFLRFEVVSKYETQGKLPGSDSDNWPEQICGPTTRAGY
jgi:hypothetical protein